VDPVEHDAVEVDVETQGTFEAKTIGVRLGSRVTNAYGQPELPDTGRHAAHADATHLQTGFRIMGTEVVAGGAAPLAGGVPFRTENNAGTT